MDAQRHSVTHVIDDSQAAVLLKPGSNVQMPCLWNAQSMLSSIFHRNGHGAPGLQSFDNHSEPFAYVTRAEYHPLYSFLMSTNFCPAESSKYGSSTCTAESTDTSVDQ